MPHIYISEKDSTIAGRGEESTNVVFIPGLLEQDAKWERDSEEKILDPIRLFKSMKAFEEKAGKPQANNLNSIMAEKLLELGMYVLFEAVGSVDDTDFFDETAELASGELPELDFDEVAKKASWSELKDKGLYKVKFLTTGAAKSGAFAEIKDPETHELHTVGADMLGCAASRGDCIALLDHEKEVDVAAGSTMAETVHEKFFGLSELDSAKMAAAFSPWCKCWLSKKETELPGSFIYLSAYGATSKDSPNWFAYAGSMRGKAPFKIEPLSKYGDAAAAVLQSRDIEADGDFGEDDNIGFAVNPICNIDPFGNIVWGNRTLMYNAEGLRASSFLNIRNLVCDIKKTLYKASRKFTFEQNDDILWANFCSEISPLLDRALSGSGIRGYKITQEETSIKGRLKAHIKIIPIEAAEDFDLTVEMTDSLETVTENA